MAAIMALDAAPGSLTDRVLSYMRFKCQGGVLRGLEREAFSLRCSVKRLQRIITSWLRRARSFGSAKAPIACSPDRQRSGTPPPLARPANKKDRRERCSFAAILVRLCYPYLDYTFEVYGYLSKTQVTDTLRQKNRRTYPLVSLSQKCDISARYRDLK